MLSNKQIEAEAQKAAEVAYAILGLDCNYSIVLINDPDVSEDARIDTTKNEIQLNLNKLQPFQREIASLYDEIKTDKDRLADENYRHLLKICYLVFHEMRHIYQIQAVNIYSVKKRMGGYSGVSSLESEKKAARWLEEMKDDCTIPPESRDTEADANAFAYYLTNRYPRKLPMAQTNRLIGAMKRKYDKIPIPEE